MQLNNAITGNPFGVLTAVVAPAILTNACSILALGTANRLARVVDRTRIVMREMAAAASGSPQYRSLESQFHALETRAGFLLKALRMFYSALGLFASAALLSVGGSIAIYYGQRWALELAAALAIATGTSAVLGLAYGCVLMVRETRLAVGSLAEEARGHAALHAGERRG